MRRPCGSENTPRLPRLPLARLWSDSASRGVQGSGLRSDPAGLSERLRHEQPHSDPPRRVPCSPSSPLPRPAVPASRVPGGTLREPCGEPRREPCGAGAPPGSARLRLGARRAEHARFGGGRPSGAPTARVPRAQRAPARRVRTPPAACGSAALLFGASPASGRRWSPPLRAARVRRSLFRGCAVAYYVVAFGGSRSLPGAFAPLVAAVVAAVPGGALVSVPCGGGAAALVRLALRRSGRSFRLFSAGSFAASSWAGRLVLRSRALVSSAAVPGGALVLFFASAGSVWSLGEVAFAASLGVPVFAFSCGFAGSPAVPPGALGSWVAGSFCGFSCWVWAPAAVQPALF